MPATSEHPVVSYVGRGVTSRSDVSIEIRQADPGHGIVFAVAGRDRKVEIPAKAKFVVNTMRNVVLGAEGARLCIVEHFLCAAAVWGLDDLYVTVDGLEMPLGDGSAAFWIDLFAGAGWQQKPVSPSVDIREPIICARGDRLLMAIPDEKFSVTYLMDWNHPMIGKRWQSWEPAVNAREIADARTFGWLKDHQLLGLDKDVLSMTPDGFTQPLRFEDEPVRHKLLDLVGDLALSGFNPLSIKARFISIKGGHEMDVEMAKRIAEIGVRN